MVSATRRRITDALQCVSAHDLPCFFPGIDLAPWLKMSDENCLKCLADADVHSSYVSSYRVEILELCRSLSGQYLELLRDTNGIRWLNRISIFGVPLTAHATQLRLPVSLFDMNILERQIERADDEIYIGVMVAAGSRIFLKRGTGRVIVKQSGTGHTLHDVDGVFEVLGLCRVD